MKLYIDPGTGSMLFAVLIGIIGAVAYVFKEWAVKLKFLLTGGKKADTNTEKIPIVIFSDDKRYWSVFKPICEEMNSRGIDVVYMTASKDDPAFDENLQHLDAQFIGEGNRAFSKLNFLNATMLISTTPGLDVFQWKRSKNVDYYVHVLHAASNTCGYHMFGIDYYDAVLISGNHHERDIRALEKIRNLPAKELVMVGVPYMDAMVNRLAAAPPLENKERTVLLAPSWGKSSILNKFGDEIIKTLLETGYHIIIRPHPQSFTSEADLMNHLMTEFPNSNSLEWNRDSDNFDVLRRSDILISDFSGIVYDYSLVYRKPVIYADVEFDDSPYDAWWLDTPFWPIASLPKIGKQLTKDNMQNLKELIDSCIESTEYKNNIDSLIEETWQYKGEGAIRTADYIVNKYNELTEKNKANL